MRLFLVFYCVNFFVWVQDKLTLEPYSSQKHILYIVLSPGGDTFADTLKTFFCNLSVTYKVLCDFVFCVCGQV